MVILSFVLVLNQSRSPYLNPLHWNDNLHSSFKDLETQVKRSAPHHRDGNAPFDDDDRLSASSAPSGKAFLIGRLHQSIQTQTAAAAAAGGTLPSTADMDDEEDDVGFRDMDVHDEDDAEVAIGAEAVGVSGGKGIGNREPHLHHRIHPRQDVERMAPQRRCATDHLTTRGGGTAKKTERRRTNSVTSGGGGRPGIAGKTCSKGGRGAGSGGKVIRASGAVSGGVKSSSKKYERSEFLSASSSQSSLFHMSDITSASSFKWDGGKRVNSQRTAKDHATECITSPVV